MRLSAPVPLLVLAPHSELGPPTAAAAEVVTVATAVVQLKRPSLLSLLAIKPPLSLVLALVLVQELGLVSTVVEAVVALAVMQLLQPRQWRQQRPTTQQRAPVQGSRHRMAE